MNTLNFQRASTSALAATLLTALFAVTSPTVGQGTKLPSPACSVPSTYASRWVCESAYMTSMFEMVRAKARQLSGTTPMRVSSRQEQAVWEEVTLGKDTVPALLPERVAARYRLLDRANRDTVAALEARPHQADIERACVAMAPPLFETLALTCKVVAVEGIAPGIVGQRHTWFGPLGPDVRDAGVTIIESLAILQATDPSAAPEDRIYELVGWVGAEAGTLGTPLFITDGRVSFITIPQNSMGSSGASSDSVLYRAGPQKPWQEIDSHSWALDLDRRLPRGLLAKQAYSLDLLTMHATTDIARAGDPNCCPSGGTADISLALRDDTLVIDSLVLRRPPNPAPAKKSVH